MKKFLFLSFVIIVLDQVSKYFVRQYFASHAVAFVPVIGNLLRFTHTQNYGVAFSLSTGNIVLNRILFSAVNFIASILIVILIKKTPQKLPRFCFSLILAGAIGNMIDRILLGSVTDFIDCDFPDFIMQRFAIFNIADSSIFIGVVIYAFYGFFIEPKLAKNQEAKNFSGPESIAENPAESMEDK